ncbi:MAG: fumarate reductase (quinol) flavoprotein subunit [Cellulomonadaceae bacterium]|jgi:fumarate reductase flavoprotein subunit|nr:fumarate reductase (quinol) flavoprotein subunit [Cellulomonadaceae bacterium]
MFAQRVDVVIVGGGGAGLRAAIEIARTRPELTVALVSKVYPMRSHTVAAEGGAAGVRDSDDSLQAHFADTVAGGDWLCDQEIVQWFVERAASELVQLERWGCPWSRRADGTVDVRKFGGMSRARTWFAADKTGFHILHTLFHTSLQYPSIQRFDEHLLLDLVVLNDGAQGTEGVHGVVVYDQRNGYPIMLEAAAVILATGGAARVFRQNTNATIVTGEGMAMAMRAGAPLRDLEFVQYHPTGLPGSGILVSEACRGEGGVLRNAEGRRYLADYGLGPETPLGEPVPKHMELGPRDRLSQAFWHEQQAGRTIPTSAGDAVHLDLRHLGRAKLHERLPLAVELAERYVGVDPTVAPIPVAPSAHYTMGGVRVNRDGSTCVPGLFAVGEAASSGLHGANRLGSNSLTELLVCGRAAGRAAADRAFDEARGPSRAARALGADLVERYTAMMGCGTESAGDIRQELGTVMADEVGIFRTAAGLDRAAATVAALRERYQDVRVTDDCPVFNTEWAGALELGGMLDVAAAMVAAAQGRSESRGSHQRLDFPERDDQGFLRHSLARYAGPVAAPTIAYEDVRITSMPPAARAYGGGGS